MDALERLELGPEIAGTFEDGGVTIAEVRLRRVTTDDGRRWWMLSSTPDAERDALNALPDLGIVSFAGGQFAHVHLSPVIDGHAVRLAVSVDGG